MQPLVSRVALATGLSYEVLRWPASDPGSDHTLLLLHGFLDLAWGWKRVVETGLFSRYHVIAPSFRGHGGSDWIGEGGTYYFLDYIGDLVSLVEKEVAGRLSIVGHSMGGMVASYFTGTYPDRVERMATLEGLSPPESPTGPERVREAVKGRVEALVRRGTQALPGSKRFPSLEAAAERMRRHDPALDPAFALELAAHGCVALPSGEYVFRYDPLHATRTPVGYELAISERFWNEVRCDVLYLEGADSPWKIVGEDRARRLGAFKHARSLTEVTIPGVGHMMLRNKPAETAAAIAAFLSR